jgi:hypothetical protein
MGPCRATQEASWSHVAVRGRASQAGPHEAEQWTNLLGRGHDSGGHRVAVEEHVELGERCSGRGGRCNALNLGVEFFLLFPHQIQALPFPFPFSLR